jgi:hypothetical protein
MDSRARLIVCILWAKNWLFGCSSSLVLLHEPLLKAPLGLAQGTPESADSSGATLLLAQLCNLFTWRNMSMFRLTLSKTSSPLISNQHNHASNQNKLYMKKMRVNDMNPFRQSVASFVGRKL